MPKAFLHTVVVLLTISFPGLTVAGPYAPAAGQPGSTAISKDAPAFLAWATGVEEYAVGADVSSTFRNTQNALGKAEGNSFDIVSLGRGGSITLTFDQPITNGAGWDFAVFENSFNDTFLELAYVEVSSDGIHFVRFDNDSLTQSPVGGFGAIDPTDIDVLAGKYRQGYGTPFDLQALVFNEKVLSGLVDLASITRVRIVDIVGDGSSLDTDGDVIWDPYPTASSAGFDLDAVGVIHQEMPNLSDPDQPILTDPEEGKANVPLSTTFKTDPFNDDDTPSGDFHAKTQWQISRNSDFTVVSDLFLDTTSLVSLTSLKLLGSFLNKDTRYFWRARFFDSAGNASPWSQTFSFVTINLSDDPNSNGIPDDQELETGSAVDLDRNNQHDVDQVDDHFKVLNSMSGSGQMALKADHDVRIKRFEAIDPLEIPQEGPEPPTHFLLSPVSVQLELTDPAKDTAEINVYLSEPAPLGFRWYKYDSRRGWFVFPNATFSPNRTVVTLTLKDGGEGDSDGLRNGLIIDPGGVGQVGQTSSGNSGAAPPSGSAGIGGGCFINAMSNGF